MFRKVGMSRRGFLRTGYSGLLGLTMPALLSRSVHAAVPVTLAGSAPAEGRAKSVLFVLLSGGLSQLESFDMKPSAPDGIRGDFQPVSTATPGIQYCEHLPRLAQRSGQLAVVRTMAHREHNHLLAMHEILTGRPTPNPRAGSDLDRVQTRDDFPNYAAALDYLRPRRDGIPTGVSLPNYLIEGPLTWPGQHAGFLGIKHDPWPINQDPNDPNFKVESLTLREGVDTRRLGGRKDLLADINGLSGGAVDGGLQTSFAQQQETAFSLLLSGKVTQAFEIGREPDEVRERYGRNKFGQSLLLSRRLIEAGVPMVQAAMGIVQTWDTHVDHFGRLKKTLYPQLDQGLAALFDDLSERGLLEETLVVVTGEFGRTPRISTLPGQTIPGRDHWAHTYSALFAGAGVRGGKVIGRTDATAAYPLTPTFGPGDLCTTIFRALGVPADAEVHDRVGRPNRLLNGEVIAPLYTGNEV